MATPRPLADTGAARDTHPRGSHPRATRTRAARTGIALLAASLPMFMATLDNLVMTTALPVLRTELHASLSELQWMINAYTLAFASLMITRRDAR